MLATHEINHPLMIGFVIGEDGELYKKAYTDPLNRSRATRKIESASLVAYRLIINKKITWIRKDEIEKFAVKIAEPYDIGTILKIFK